MAANDTSSLRVGWVPEPAGRGTASLIYSCLFTIFICAWNAVHLDIPKEGTTAWSTFRFRIRWMVIAILAPEVATVTACEEWVEAYKLLKTLRDPPALDPPDCAKATTHTADAGSAPIVEERQDWTMTHCHFVRMGGLRISSPGKKSRRLPADHCLTWGLYFADPPMSEFDIQDKSKASPITKVLACMQISWLVVQLVGRAAQHSSASLLKVT